MVDTIERLSIVGTAARLGVDKAEFCMETFVWMIERVWLFVRTRKRRRYILVSGAAAGADHVAVFLFNSDVQLPEQDRWFIGLELCMPAPWLSGLLKWEDTSYTSGHKDGRTAHYYHELFTKTSGVPDKCFAVDKSG